MTTVRGLDSRFPGTLRDQEDDVGDSPHTPTTPDSADLERRQFLRRAAVAGAIWAVPTVIAIKPASAAGLHSAPPPKHVDHFPTAIDPVVQTPPKAVSPTEL